MINIDHLHCEKRDPNIDAAVTVALRHIGIAVYSSGKIYEYLIRKGYESDIAHTAVQELIDRKYIDDIRAGRKVLLSRTGRKQESRALLYKRLIQAGISEDKADIIITRTRDDYETCIDLLSAAFPVIPDETDSIYEEAMKLGSRRGYYPDTIRKAFNYIVRNKE